MCKKIYMKLIITTSILILLIVLGSFYDYQIANKVYLGQNASNNFYGILFSYIGILPAFGGWSFLGASILPLRKKYNKKASGWLLALSILLFVLSYLHIANTIMMVNEKAFEVHWTIAYSIGMIVTLGCAYLGYILAEKSKNENLLNMILFVILISFITFIITMSVKGIMGRPRFRFILEMDVDPTQLFKNWWEMGHELKACIPSNLIGDEFSSFPSGHSSYSMFAIFIFPLLAEYNENLKKYKNTLFILGVVWWVLTAFSRLTVGAHYLTDVCFGGLVTILAYLISLGVKWIIIKSKIKKS